MGGGCLFNVTHGRSFGRRRNCIFFNRDKMSIITFRFEISATGRRKSIDPFLILSRKKDAEFVCWLISNRMEGRGGNGNINEHRRHWNAAGALVDLIAFEFFDFLH